MAFKANQTSYIDRILKELQVMKDVVKDQHLNEQLKI